MSAGAAHTGAVLYRHADGEPVFVEYPAPTNEDKQAALLEIVTGTMKSLTRPALANERARCNVVGQAAPKLKTPGETARRIW